MLTQIKGIIVGIDGSTNALSIALFDQKKVIGSIFIEEALHSRMIVSVLNDLLSKHGVELFQIEGLCFTNGPGRYSSLRATLATIKGLFYGFEKEVLCINTLDLIAAGFEGNGNVCVRAKTSKGEVSFFYSVNSLVKRVNALSNAPICECKPDIKNLFRIDSGLFKQCSLNSIMPVY